VTAPAKFFVIFKLGPMAITSSILLSRNSQVASLSELVSYSRYNSVTAYKLDTRARLVYHERSTDVSPAECQTSSEMSWI